MLNRLGKLLSARTLAAALALVMVFFSLTVAPTVPKADGCCSGPSEYETVINYYTDATHTTWSGMRRTLCSGYWTQIGTSTQYYVVTHPPCDCEVTPC